MYCATRPSCIVGRLSTDLLPEVEVAISRRRLERGETLVNEGDVPRHVSVVKIGTVFGLRRGLDGDLRPVGVAGRGASFGLMGYFDLPTQVTGVAAASSRVCDIPHASLRDAARRDPDFAGHIVRSTALGIGLIADWSVGIRVRGVPNQLASALLLMARTQKTSVLDLPTHAALTELLGATRETVARAFSTLRVDGCIKLIGRRKCEVDTEALMRRLREGDRRNPRKKAA